MTDASPNFTSPLPVRLFENLSRRGREMKIDSRLSRMTQPETRADGGEVMRCSTAALRQELQTTDVFQFVLIVTIAQGR